MTQLADEGFLSPSDVVTARALFRRRLVYRDRHLKFITRSFRRFALSAEPAAEVRKWEARERSVWAQLRMPLQASLALVGGVLLWTQEELRTAAVAIPTVVTSTLPLLVRLAGKMGGDGNAAKGDR